jgi:hypothetical protein
MAFTAILWANLPFCSWTGRNVLYHCAHQRPVGAHGIGPSLFAQSGLKQPTQTALLRIFGGCFGTLLQTLFEAIEFCLQALELGLL